MSSLRILLTCEDYLPQMGGAEVCAANLKRQFEKRGHRVVMFTNTLAPNAPADSSVVRVPWKFTPAGVCHHMKILWKLIGQSDIVHCEYSFRIACICAVIARMRGVPMVLTQQGRGIVPEAGTKWRYLPFLRLCQHVSMRGASAITSTSDEITDLTARFVRRSKIVLVTNGYDDVFFSPDSSLPLPPEYARISSSQKKILTVRRLVPKNGIHILLQALALVKEKRIDFHYFAVGDGRSRPIIERLIRELKLTEHVTLLGSRANDTIKPYLQHADLVVVPSSAEATSIACIEAMGMEKPLIASRVGGLIDLLGKEGTYGTLVPIYDSEACTYDPPDTLPRERLLPLANAILAFLDQPAPFVERARKAAPHVRQKFTWSAIAEQYLQIFFSLLPKLPS